MRGSSIFGAMALTAVTALPLAAQQHGQHQGAMGMQDSTTAGMHGMHGGMMSGGMMGMMGSMDGMGMMASMPPGPGMILGAADELELTPDQMERLTALRDRTRDEHMQQMQAATTERRAAARTLEQEGPDVEAFESHMRSAADQMVALHVAMVRDALAAREILTEAQRVELQEVVSMMRHMHGGGMGMMQGSGVGPGGPPGAAR